MAHYKSDLKRPKAKRVTDDATYERFTIPAVSMMVRPLAGSTDPEKARFVAKTWKNITARDHCVERCLNDSPAH